MWSRNCLDIPLAKPTGKNELFTPVRVIHSLKLNSNLQDFAPSGGMVAVDMRIGINGELLDHCVIDMQPQRFGYLDNLLNGIEPMTFEPAKVDGMPVEGRHVLLIPFWY